MADEYSVLPIKIGLFTNEARSDRARLLGLTRELKKLMKALS